MNLISSQEPQTPAVPGGTAVSPARTRKSTRRSKLVEETQQNEVLAGGDKAEIREVREVREVVKRVAVVKAQKKKRSGAIPQVEEVPTDQEGAEEEKEEEEAPAVALRRSGRGASTRRQATSVRLGKELDEVMAAAERAAGGRRAGAAAAAGPRTTVRAYEVEVTEEEEGCKGEEEEGEEEEADAGIAAEEPAGAQHIAGAAGRHDARRRAPGVLSEKQIPSSEEVVYYPIREESGDESEAEEPSIPMQYVQATQEAMAEKESSEEEEEEKEHEEMEVHEEEREEGMFLTPDEIPGSFPPEEEEESEEVEEEEMPAPTTKRGKRAAGKETEPKTPAKGVLGALAGVTETFRSVLPGGSKGAIPAHHEDEEEEEEEEAVPAPVAARGRTASKRPPAKKAPVPSKGRKKIPATGRGHRGRVRHETYKSYILKVLKQVHPGTGISSKAMDVMHNFMVDQFDKIVEEAARLVMKDKKKTLTAREIQTAVRLVLPGELGKHAVSEGKKAVGCISGVRM